MTSRLCLILAPLLAAALAGCGGEAPASQPSGGVATTAASPEQPPQGPERLILAFGDSLYAGYNLSRDEAYPAQLERALWREGINARVVNAGVSGDTTAAGRQRLGFTLANLPRNPDLAIVGLGANDMLRGLPPAEVRSNLDAILSELKARGAALVVTGMVAAPNLGEDYAAAFNPIFPELARRHDAVLVPFFLQPVIADPSLVQSDRLHPTAEGVAAMVADTIDEVTRALPPASPPVSPSVTSPGSPSPR